MGGSCPVKPALNPPLVGLFALRSIVYGCSPGAAAARKGTQGPSTAAWPRAVPGPVRLLPCKGAGGGLAAGRVERWRHHPLLPSDMPIPILSAHRLSCLVDEETGAGNGWASEVHGWDCGPGRRKQACLPQVRGWGQVPGQRVTNDCRPQRQEVASTGPGPSPSNWPHHCSPHSHGGLLIFNS